MSAKPPCPTKAAVSGLIPMVHVARVARSLDFYEMLGFQRGNSFSGEDGVLNWASMHNALAQIMFARADAPIVPESQAILLYLYTDDVATLREHLLACGLPDGGTFCGVPRKADGNGVLFAITHPFYMPAGELRVEDPDGYCLLVGQLGEQND